MENDYFINRMNISHYQALLQTDLDDKTREIVHKLLAELERCMKPQPALDPARIVQPDLPRG